MREYMSAILAKKQVRLILIAAAIVAALIIVRVRINHAHAEKIRDGVAYLETMQAADVAAVESEIRAIEKAHQQEDFEKSKQALESGEEDVWNYFKDDVILGDSRAVGFSYYGFLPEERVLAEGGNTIRDIAKFEPQLEQLNPSRMFFCYGLNDMLKGFWNSAEEYVDEYLEIYRDLSEKFPEAELYISLAIPAQDAAYAKFPQTRNIPEYNNLLRSRCQEEGIRYVDNDAISQEYASLWEPDGVHVTKAFYPYWATNMIMTAFEQGGEAGADAADDADSAGTTEATEDTDAAGTTEAADEADAAGTTGATDDAAGTTDAAETTEEVPA